MKSLVIFESFFGNTEQGAMALGTVLGEPGYVKVVRVADLQANDWQDADRVVIGSPTRGFQATPAVMTPPSFTGFSAARPSSVVVGRMVSSRSSPSSGAISEANQPFSVAACAR